MDQIPWWLYILIAVPLIGGLMYFLSPVLIPLWRMTPTWVKGVGGFLLALGLAFVSGRNKGSRDAKEMQKRRDAEAVQNRERIHREVDHLNEPDVDKRLNKWMRD